MSRSRRLRCARTVAASIAVAAVTGMSAIGSASAGWASAAAAVRHGPPSIAAYAAELANGTTGKQLWGRRQYSPRPIASITKVMTALVVVQSHHLGRRIKITAADVEYARAHDSTSAGLHPGDVLTAGQLLYAMLLPSGADAAHALAVSFGPGWQAFVRKMNATARRLRLVRTSFATFIGLSVYDQSTPRNLLLLGEAAMRQPVIRDVVARRRYLLRAGSHHHRYLWQNTNLLLGRYPGAIGIKTGWTPSAGECLLFEATRNKRLLIGVVLDSAPTKTGASFTDAARLLNWGFGLHNAVRMPRPPAGGPGE